MVVLDGLTLKHLKAWISPLNFIIFSTFSQIRQSLGSMCELGKIIWMAEREKKKTKCISPRSL